MNEESAFIRSICGNPKDNVVRLAYADWLDETNPGPRCRWCAGTGASNSYHIDTCPECKGNRYHPNPRAEFIRIQCEIDAQKKGQFKASEANDRRQDWLTKRETELLEQYEVDWLNGPSTWPLWDVGFQANSTWVPESEWFWERGFVHKVAMPLRWFMGGKYEGTEYKEAAGPLFTTWPIETVVTDRTPSNPGNGFSWFPTDKPYQLARIDLRSHIPREIFVLIEGGEWDGSGLFNNPGWKTWWGTNSDKAAETAAMDALGAALVKWGKIQARKLS
jgi:uncharacterized protein (TIGR02996 family)